MSDQKLVVCINCGWVHMEVSRVYAENSVASFNKMYWSDPKARDTWNSEASLDEYSKCDNCGSSYTNFRDLLESDSFGIGSTVGPIISRSE